MSFVSLEDPFSSIGLLCCLYIAFVFTKKIYHILRIFVFTSYPDFSKYGKWSVITGGTSGIGKALAFQLASKGQNIILLGRGTSKLTKISHEIESQHNVETKYFDVDFSCDETIYEKIDELLRDLDIGVLVNNVAIRACPVEFLETPGLTKLIQDIFRVNMLSSCKMQQIVLPGMVDRGRGLVINMSSAAGFIPFRCFAIYGATKAFVDNLSQALSYEYADKGVTIQSCIPFWVSTNMTEHPKPNTMIRTADQYATTLLATVDKERRTHGCWQHTLQAWVLKSLPLTWVHRLLADPTEDLLQKMTINKRPDSVQYYSGNKSDKEKPTDSENKTMKRKLQKN